MNPCPSHQPYYLTLASVNSNVIDDWGHGLCTVLIPWPCDIAGSQGGLDKVTHNIRLLSQHMFCYWVLHRNSESSSSDLKAV